MISFTTADILNTCPGAVYRVIIFGCKGKCDKMEKITS
jgi:hypothetical protein